MNPGVQEGYYGDPTCYDGVDNDCDGLTDMDDPQCIMNPTDPWESASTVTGLGGTGTAAGMLAAVLLPLGFVLLLKRGLGRKGPRSRGTMTRQDRESDAGTGGGG